ncbi:hypothetical protein ACIP10_25805 [Streptomyces galbus]|uniref:hypothetical protein n=1 Tax=Streptomyces galbus TaxID=33898 RepID=UPI00379EF919
MSDQHVAAALTAAAVVAAVLVARAAVLHQGRRHAGARVRARRGVVRSTVPAPVTVPDDQAARSAVQEAEQYVQHCWQQLQARTDPPE